jgi:hypothetical protein
MPVGTFRLTYAYTNGGRRYEYDVKPDTASVTAAMMVARRAMEEAIKAESEMYPEPKIYTKKQLKIMKKFREDMGGFYPQWWCESSYYDISQAAIDAVMNYKP